ncbi:MAG: xanthine dehydrogenase family protein subunit M [Candidatus Rokubacteria bacterium]|nr:xanthine dehydrogenase family protein subunit M [Candidatus Rokubacteria bacterium]
MQPFEYAAPASVDEALALLARHGADAKVLAGGQSLVPLLNYRLARPRFVVDVNDLPLDEIRVDAGRVRLGALVRHSTLAASAVVARECPLLTEAAALIGNVRVRSLGTVGGSLAHADPAAELPLAMVALDARFELRSARGSRTVEVRDFFSGYLTTVLRPDELLTSVDAPPTRGAGTAVEEFSRRPGDFALVAVAAIVTIDRQGRVENARVAIGGIDGVPRRIPAVENALRGEPPATDRIARAAELARAEVTPQSDALASGEYRTLLAGVLTKRALARAVSRAMAVPA